MISLCVSYSSFIWCISPSGAWNSPPQKLVFRVSLEEIAVVDSMLLYPAKVLLKSLPSWGSSYKFPGIFQPEAGNPYTFQHMAYIGWMVLSTQHGQCSQEKKPLLGSHLGWTVNLTIPPLLKITMPQERQETTFEILKRHTIISLTTYTWRIASVVGPRQ